jgi:hypothetical protein
MFCSHKNDAPVKKVQIRMTDLTLGGTADDAVRNKFSENVLKSVSEHPPNASTERVGRILSAFHGHKILFENQSRHLSGLDTPFRFVYHQNRNRHFGSIRRCQPGKPGVGAIGLFPG